MTLFNPDTSLNPMVTTYPPHLNYTTTLPRKIITMKITIFIIVLALKSNETWKFDISDCHSLLTVQNPVKTVYLKTMFKVSAPSFHTSSKSFDKAQYGLVDGVLCILFARLSSARQWYLAWVEMSCSVQA